jgi:DNA polymerase IV
LTRLFGRRRFLGFLENMSSSDVFAPLPPIFVLPTHLSTEEQYEIEDELAELGGQLTYDAKEARIFLARITQKKRANFELRTRGVWTEEVAEKVAEPARKRRRIDPNNEGRRTSGSETTSEDELHDAGPPVMDAGTALSPLVSLGEAAHIPSAFDLVDKIMVLKLCWLDQCLKQRSLVPFASYVIYRARIISRPDGEKSPKPLADAQTYTKAGPSLNRQASFMNTTGAPRVGTNLTSIISRAKAEAASPSTPSSQTFNNQHARRRFNQTSSSTPALTHPNRPPKLYRTTTSEFENRDSRSLPEPPQWVREHEIYACRRSTPMKPKNEAFLRQLHRIKEARLLTLDEIGVRAYSTAIASISAYPHVLQSHQEVARLPGCENKIAMLWSEWYGSAYVDDERSLEVVKALDADEDIKHLRLFFEIWGVGADTARRFYFTNKWKDIDDVVEFGWGTLNRVQQIGVKFYDEFQVKIPRAEVESISDTVLRHARRCRGIPKDKWGTDEDMVLVIVGGYRRGKELCGDVDVILSHRDEERTKDLVVDVVASLETEGWITHTLTLNTTTSDRNQQTLPYRGDGMGGGFDSLDKALCVWQDPTYDSEEYSKNPNIHRRVDIIVSSWRTVGCAILGWSGATTFERDIRRWCKREKGWKFDSSGVRDRATGLVMDLESPKHNGDGDSWLDRENRLMEGLGIGWRPPTERCTG